MRRARSSVAAAAPVPDGVDTDDRRRIADYLLNPSRRDRRRDGRAARALPRGARPGRGLVRLADLYVADPPPLPGEDEDASPGKGHRVDPGGKVRQRRETRKQRHDLVEGQKAAAIAVGPVPRQGGAPSTASARTGSSCRTTRRAPRGWRSTRLVAVLVAGLALCSLVSVPVYTSREGPGRRPARRRAGRRRRWPGGRRAVSDRRSRIAEGRAPSDAEAARHRRARQHADPVRRPRDARAARDRRALRAARAAGAARAAPARRRDRGARDAGEAPPRSSFEGAVTTEAEARTGSERIVGLPF